jgi:hypothetical protein
MAWSIALIREGSKIRFFPVDEMVKAIETKCCTAYVGKEAIQRATKGGYLYSAWAACGSW